MGVLFLTNHEWNLSAILSHTGFKLSSLTLKSDTSITSAKPNCENLFFFCSHKYARRSRPEVFCKKGVLRNFAKFTGKHLCQGLFSNKLAGLRPATLLKKRLLHRCFPLNCAEFLGTPFFIEHLRWLLLVCVVYLMLMQEAYLTFYFHVMSHFARKLGSLSY